MDSRVRRFEVQTYPIRHALSSMGSNVNLKKRKREIKQQLLLRVVNGGCGIEHSGDSQYTYPTMTNFRMRWHAFPFTIKETLIWKVRKLTIARSMLLLNTYKCFCPMTPCYQIFASLSSKNTSETTKSPKFTSSYQQRYITYINRFNTHLHKVGGNY